MPVLPAGRKVPALGAHQPLGSLSLLAGTGAGAGVSCGVSRSVGMEASAFLPGKASKAQAVLACSVNGCSEGAAGARGGVTARGLGQCPR